MQVDENLAFFSHVVSSDFDILVALLTKTKEGEIKQENQLEASRDFHCYYPDHHQYSRDIAVEVLRQSGFCSYEKLLRYCAGLFEVQGDNIEEIEHNLMFSIMAYPLFGYSRQDFIRLALELRIEPNEYSIDGIKKALLARFADNEILPLYQVSLLINALILGYFSKNPCADSVPYTSSFAELRSVEQFTKYKLFEHDFIKPFNDTDKFLVALTLCIIAMRKKDAVFYGRSGDSKAELIRKLKRYTVLLKTVPSFAKSEHEPVIGLVYAFNVVYLSRYKMPLPREMACEMLFGTALELMPNSVQALFEQAEKCAPPLEELSAKLLAFGITKDQMQDLIGILALSNNQLIKIENIFIEWSVKLGLR